MNDSGACVFKCKIFLCDAVNNGFDCICVPSLNLILCIYFQNCPIIFSPLVRLKSVLVTGSSAPPFQHGSWSLISQCPTYGSAQPFWLTTWGHPEQFSICRGRLRFLGVLATKKYFSPKSSKKRTPCYFQPKHPQKEDSLEFLAKKSPKRGLIFSQKSPK